MSTTDRLQDAQPLRRWLLVGAVIAMGLSAWLVAGPARAQDATTAPPPTVAGQLPAANIAARAQRQRQAARTWRSDGTPAESADEDRPWSSDPALVALGRKLYLDGMRESGAPLAGKRLDGQVQISGAAAACALCHRRSGLGAVEGSNQIAPISGRYLFDQDSRALVNMSIRARKAFNQRHEPYTLASLALALREGRHPGGSNFDELMPRYDVSDREVLALASYLRGLSNGWSPGVTDRTVRLATIVTPDVDARRRLIFLDTLSGIVAQKNGNIVAGQRNMSSGAEMALRTDRQWDMSIWELHGPASSWQSQLEAHYAANPVFAITSGLGAGNWAPVHRFCESRKLPCWFPSVGAVPPAGSQDFYSVYFSRGAGLEADVLAKRLIALSERHRDTKLLQVYEDVGVEESAVVPLKRSLAGTPLRVSTLKLKAGSRDFGRALADLGEHDSVVFWLTPLQMKSLAGVKPPRAQVYFSSALGGADNIELPSGWREKALLLYPYQLPAVRDRGLTYFKEWLRIRQLPLADEVLQSEVYFSMSYFNDTLVDMLDNVHRDYLLERGENMLSLREAAKAEDEARELSLPKSHLVGESGKLRNFTSRPIVPRRSAHAGAVAIVPMASNVSAAAPDFSGQAGVSETSGAAESTTVYPRLSLGQLQRHASKGAYIVHLGGGAGDPMHVESDWVTP
jgi:hypothetical protein